MSSTLHLLKEKKFLLTSLSGELTDDTLLQHVLNLNGVVEGIANLLELADCRTLTSLEKLTVKGTCLCADRENLKPGSRLAILVLDNPMMVSLAKGYQTFARDKRAAVEVFTNYHSALNWLIHSPEDLVIINRFIQQYASGLELAN